jgi:23S rRNA pseudouridine2457 synthase
MRQKNHRYYVVNKPYDMVSQFISPHPVRVLGGLGFDFPEGTHPIGRLDNHSEGLLILTTDKRITRLLFQGTTPHRRVYLVKVKRVVSNESLEQLRSGISIRVHGGGHYTTAPCEVEKIPEPLGLFRHEKETKDYLPYSWLRITLTEGKFHQVRKIVAGIGHRCIRLIRVSIEDLTIDGIEAGGVREVEESVFFAQLKISS